MLPLLFLAVACTAKIGDSCSYDIDCSANYDRTCDSLQPGGYCLIISCEPDECPKEAVCVEFTTPCPDGPAEGEDGYEEHQEICEQIEPNRNRSYCLKRCTSDDGCRSRYECVLPDVEEEEMGERTSDLPVLESTAIIDFDVSDPNVGYCVPSV